MVKTQREKERFLNAGAIASRLRKIRKYFGYSQDEMADLLGITKETYGKNERAYHLLQALTLGAIHEKLGISIEWLLFNRAPVFWNPDKKRKDMEFKGDISGNVPVTPELAEMIDLLNRIPFLRNLVLGYYQKLKLENQHLISESLEKE